MALPRPQQIAFTPGEIEYIAGNEKIKIIPNVRFPDISLIQGDIRKFRPPLSVEVPLWIALILKAEHKCNIICPDWLTVDHLKKRQEEEEKEEEFSRLPFHYMEISQLLIETAPDDVPNVEQIRTILKNIRETRQVKARIGLEYLDDKWLGMSRLSLMEINQIKPFFSKAFEEMRRLNVKENNPGH
ncbi:DNA replication complex GINS protein PSF2 [Rhizopus microsporus var. microsporus]|uniref:DNA replication complex GINS protein PSF2 n=2 Tax=Rhizopus microsporus TaxID=58291 RepID=A0A2G4SF32_RHIZD|nr:DNA replication complex GINS protein psf2 [Rhizopus microsporus ATCC 52813]ORE04404.1 DNA replication complex GINS protein PSF2 [Rhizopus microsporus var. microsporus]PHZ07388.1 DNA replication complex GINS protein psf2 [Rhizopus microsporus ATCC 52813]